MNSWPESRTKGVIILSVSLKLKMAVIVLLSIKENGEKIWNGKKWQRCSGEWCPLIFLDTWFTVTTSTFVAMNSMMNLFWTFKCRVRISRTLRKNECRKTKRHDHPPHHRQIDWKYLLVYDHLPSVGMFTSIAKCRTGVRTLWQDLLTPILPTGDSHR